jgi:RNAse (barnase) inhibitor barstar
LNSPRLRAARPWALQRPILDLIEREAKMDTPLRKDQDVPLRGIRANIVQSIRAFRVQDLQDAATALGHHFLYANLAHAQSKQDVLDLIAQQFTLPAHFGKNFDALSDCLTDPLHKSGPQPGFVVVLEQIPATAKFDKEAREQLLDIFRDAADFWGERKIPFRCFYSFL